MFTERFLSIPSLIFNPKDEDLMGKCTKEVSCIKNINPMRIESYGDAPANENFEEGSNIWTLVIMQSGDNFIATITVQQFEKLINDFIN